MDLVKEVGNISGKGTEEYLSSRGHFNSTSCLTVTDAILNGCADINDGTFGGENLTRYPVNPGKVDILAG